MCGLAGYHSRGKKPLTLMAKDIAANIFITSQLRGAHSSGMSCLWQQEKKGKGRKARRSKKYGWLTEKGLLSPNDVMRKLEEALKNRTRKAEEDDDYKQAFVITALGHSRHATIGSVTPENSHPFSFFNNRFIGVHNGTISNAADVYHTLDKKGKYTEGSLPAQKDYSKKGEATDSETILYCIYRFGIDEVYPLLEGAWALIWYDQRTKSLNFIRNGLRSLFYTPHFASDVLFWSSEYMMLQFALHREGKVTSAKDENIKMFKVDTLYTIDMTVSASFKKRNEDFDWDSVVDYSTKRKFWRSYHQGDANGYAGYGGYSIRDHRNSVHASTSGNSKPMGSNHIANKPAQQLNKSKVLVQDPDNKGSYITEEELQKRNKETPISLSKSINLYTTFAGEEDEDEYSVENERETSCVCCNKHVDTERRSLFIPIKGVGPVCLTCTYDEDMVSLVFDSYVDEVAEDPEWLTIWNCHFEDKKKAGGCK